MPVKRVRRRGRRRSGLWILLRPGDSRERRRIGKRRISERKVVKKKSSDG
jgi:hypothetical protein